MLKRVLTLLGGRGLLPFTGITALAWTEDGATASRKHADTFQKILDVLSHGEGVPISKLRQEVACGWSALNRHLETLQAEGAAVSVKINGRRLIVLTENGAVPLETRARALLEGRTVRRVATYVMENPGLDVLAIQTGTGESRRAAYYHIRQLIQAGLVSSESTRHYCGLRATDLLQTLLTECGNAVDDPEAD